MKNKLACVFFALGVVFTTQVQAEESKLDLIYNEETIIKQLAEFEPAVSYLVRLRMMKAHLKASLFTHGSGDHAEALEHVAHPRTEILAELSSALEERGIVALLPALTRAEEAFKSGDHHAAVTAVNDALSVIGEAEKLAGSTKSNIDLIPDVIASLLRMAVVEYHEAFEYQKLSNKVEYHDGSFFVQEAKIMLEELAPDYKARNAQAYDKMIASLETLYQAWPAETPPETAVLPVTKMQALVSMTELQLNRLR